MEDEMEAREEKGLATLGGLMELDNVFSARLDVEAVKADVLALDAAARELEADDLAGAGDAPGMLDGIELADLKRLRTSLNKVVKRMEDARRDLKRDYQAPMEAVDERCKALQAQAKRTLDEMKLRIDAMESQQLAFKWQQLAEEYAAVMPEALQDAVPLERIVNPKWRNKGETVARLCEQIDDEAARVTRGWETVTGAGLAHEQQALQAYFATLDVSDAFAADKEAQAQEEAYAAMQAQAAAERARSAAWREEQAAQAVEPAPERRHRYVLEGAWTEREAGMVIEALKGLGLHGTFTRYELEGEAA